MTQLRSTTRNRKDYGDFQTPHGLVAEILDALERVGVRSPDRVLEPTCGRGHFLGELVHRTNPPREIVGFEIQADHAEVARSIESPDGLTTLDVQTADIFQVDLARDLRWQGEGSLLVVGNLPWVTTAALGASGGSNGPVRSNLKRLRGIDARTGDSNFDISEAIWLKLIRELSPQEPTMALLCKSAVARAVLQRIQADDLPVTRARLWKIETWRWFKAAVEACLLVVEVGPGPRATEAEVFDSLSDLEPGSTLGLIDHQLIADLDAYQSVAFADGRSSLVWRQGIKHDASPVMELTEGQDGRLFNKLGEVVDVEPDFVFPLLKGSDLGGIETDRPRRSVIVTQNRLGDDTETLESRAPRLWAYLVGHRSFFDRRKSSIYRGRSSFCLFGVGDYSFAPFKVAVSSLHKHARFRLVDSVEGRPTMLDDTCYFLPCRTREQAAILVEVLNGSVALGLIRSLAFSDAKRTVTKKLLQRIDLEAILDRKGQKALWHDEWAADWIRPPRSLTTR